MRSPRRTTDMNDYALLPTPAEARSGRPLNVWEGLMGSEGAHLPTCLSCAGLWCNGCGADPLSARERSIMHTEAILGQRDLQFVH
jgi:hypothetical protein